MVSCGQGQAWATESHKTGPTTPHPGLRLRFPLCHPGVSELHSGGRGCPACHLGPRQSQGHPLYRGRPRPNSRPGLAEPGVASHLRSLVGALGCVRSPAPPHCSEGTPHRKAGEPEIRARGGTGPGASGCWWCIYSPDPRPGMESHSPPEGGYVLLELGGGSCGAPHRASPLVPWAPCPASGADPSAWKGTRFVLVLQQDPPSLPPH